jgi:hypothetical protein
MPALSRRRVGAAGGIVSVLALAVGLQGCALFPLAALGGAALSTGGSTVAKVGTEYAGDGSALRTFTLPLDDVHAAILDTFERTAIRVERDEASDDGRRLVGEAAHRRVKIWLTALTPTLTAMKIVVKRNILMKDKATASELLGQTEVALADRASLAKEVRCEVDQKVTSGTAAAAPRPSAKKRAARL